MRKVHWDINWLYIDGLFSGEVYQGKRGKWYGKVIGGKAKKYRTQDKAMWETRTKALGLRTGITPVYA